MQWGEPSQAYSKFQMEVVFKFLCYRSVFVTYSAEVKQYVNAKLFLFWLPFMYYALSSPCMLYLCIVN